MGDRAVVVFTDGQEVSPSVYLHWSGSSVPALLEKHKGLMASRTGDVGYAAARFVGVCHTHIDGNLSLGLWNTPDDIAKAIRAGTPEAVMGEYSHGDAGVIVVNVDDFSWKAYAGYIARQQAGEEAA